MPLFNTNPNSPPPTAPPTQPDPTGGAGMAQGAPTNPYNIDGRLDFGAAGANFDFSGNPAAMSQNYANTYMDALRLNAQNYGNIMGGYNQTMNNQLAAQDQLNQNYTGLGNQVQGMIAGTDQAQMQRINDQYNSAMGSMNQGAINRGLGNTTVTNALGRGIESDRAQEQTNVQNQFAQLQAGYASNIGLAGLNQQGNNILANTGLAGRQLSFMEGVNAPYPNPSLYNQLGQQLGQGQQGQRDQQQFQDQLRQLQAAGNRGSGQTGLNAGGGGGVRQSAFGPGFSGGNQYPGLGPSATGGPLGGGGGGAGGYMNGGRGLTPPGRNAATGYPTGPGSIGAMQPGATSPRFSATGYPGPGNPQREATGYPSLGGYGSQGAYGGYGSVYTGGGYSGGLFGDILSWAGGSMGSYGDYGPAGAGLNSVNGGLTNGGYTGGSYGDYGPLSAGLGSITGGAYYGGGTGGTYGGYYNQSSGGGDYTGVYQAALGSAADGTSGAYYGGLSQAALGSTGSGGTYGGYYGTYGGYY